MRLVVDCRYVTPGRHNGISRYTAGLVHALADLHPLTMLISDERQLAHLPAAPWVRVSAPTSLREPLVARQVNRLAPDVVFSPMQTMGTWGRRYPVLLTLHDLIYYRHRTPPPEFAAPIRLLWRLYHLAWWPQRLLLNRADAVVTVSETSAALIATHRLTRRPVTVVPNAADPPPDPRRLPRTRALVYMGTFMPYKNVETLVRAAALLPDHELHLMSRVDARRARPAHRARPRRPPGVPRRRRRRHLPRRPARGDRAGLRLPRRGLRAAARRGDGGGHAAGGERHPGVPRGRRGRRGLRRPRRRPRASRGPSAPSPRTRPSQTASAAARERAEHYSWDSSARILLALAERAQAARRSDAVAVTSR